MGMTVCWGASSAGAAGSAACVEAPCEKVKLTGNKLSDKQYVRHSGYPGGVRVTTPAEYLKKKPEFIIEKAVKGMLPRTRLGAAQLRNLI